MPELNTQVAAELGGIATDENLQAVLNIVLAHFGGVVGTIHSLDRDAGMLHLRAQHGLPEALLPRVGVIPVGKGMAGLAAERRVPLQVCNLQTDTSGTVRPGAKETGVEGAISVPLLVGDSLRGVLGVSKPIEYEFTPAEVELLMQVGETLGRALGPDAL